MLEPFDGHCIECGNEHIDGEKVVGGMGYHYFCSNCGKVFDTIMIEMIDVSEYEKLRCDPKRPYTDPSDKRSTIC